MEQFWKDVGIAFVMGFLVPAVLLGAIASVAGNRVEVECLTEPIIVPDSTVQQASVDSKLTVSIQNKDGKIAHLGLNDYLTGVVLAEMPVSFEDEALKAQAVVARTYTIRALNGASKHENADVCADATCCQGYKDVEHYLQEGGLWENVQRIYQLVCDTDGLILTYEGDLIEATYFSCSGGITEDAVAVWGTDVPYLQSVPSPGEEDAAHYTDTVIYTVDEFEIRLGVELNGSAEKWVSETVYTNGNGVASMAIGGISFEGTQLRKLLDLRSTAFTIDATKNLITIQTRGYGHRVGMSQYGADAMAVAGRTYTEILSYYYKGTELVKYIH